MTGSPGDGSNCTSCHGGTASSVVGWITSNIPASGYVPGQTYQITATSGITTSSGLYGFEVSPQSMSGALLGTLTAGTANKLVGSGKYVTQSNASSNKVWNFTWTAPAVGCGTITFYGAFARGKPGVVRVTEYSVPENTTGIMEVSDLAVVSIFPNPCKNKFEINAPASLQSQNVSVYDVTGKEIFHSSIPANKSSLLVELNNAAKGFASVVITSDNQKIVKKLLID